MYLKNEETNFTLTCFLITLKKKKKKNLILIFLLLLLFLMFNVKKERKEERNIKYNEKDIFYPYF